MLTILPFGTVQRNQHPIKSHVIEGLPCEDWPIHPGHTQATIHKPKDIFYCDYYYY